ncbi:MAG TPA: formimidoylglutamate deiminase [Paucimonas sp.]|nr:formimidoylglutamate deiminase [Paucimonas sp.]
MNRSIAEVALLPEGWRNDVLLEWDADGLLTRVEPDSKADGVQRIAGIALPGVTNLHSHAFQRAMAGLTEYRSDPADSFWSWRTLMYAFAQKLTPSALKAIATRLYIEMLQGGYTSVCEFHYLHHDAGGKPYAHSGELAECLVEAARDAGIGLTLLPVMYQYSGFGNKPPHEGQARFINSPRWMLDLLHGLRRSHPEHAGLRYGVAPHSLRAVGRESLGELLEGLNAFDAKAPIHIHIAEQTKEVEDCIAAHGKRPVEWLLENFDVDARWCLVHATHMTESETLALARSGAVAGICPTTEANLGDGIFNGAVYAKAGGRFGVGSDSHVATCLREELRMYEYSQRLRDRQRNVLVDGERASVGAYLYRGAAHGGALASGRPVAGLAAGQRADLIVLDANHPDLAGKHGDQVLDSFVFCNHGQTPIRDVMSGGRWVVRQGRHEREDASAAAYRAALQGLLDA